MSRKLREWQPDASWLFPPSPRDWLSEDHLVYFLLDVTAQVDISPIVDDYASDNGGQPPFHPRMMLVLLLYSYSVGVFSSRKIMQRCATDAAFRIIVANSAIHSNSATLTSLAIWAEWDRQDWHEI
jgi:transposase